MCHIHIITENKNRQNELFWRKELRFQALETMLKIFHVKNRSVKSFISVLLKISGYPTETYNLQANAFENVKSQIGFCGIWCGSCGAGNEAVQELARRFEGTVKKYELDKWVPKEFDFEEFMKGLACTRAMSLCLGCRKGGGPPACEVRICALSKGMADCSECEQLVECKNFEHLEKDYPKIKEDLTKIKNENRAELIEKWTSELKNKWPHCILLCASARK